jgi:hypothetical protein
MEFHDIFIGWMWVFQPSARLTPDARRQMQDDAARILARIRLRRVRSGYRPNRTAFLQRACCDVGVLMEEVQRWGVSWPRAFAALRVAAERAWLHPEAHNFTLVPNLSKLAAGAFIAEQLLGAGIAGLEAFRDEGEWMPVGEAMQLLLPVEREASDLVDVLLEGLTGEFNVL